MARVELARQHHQEDRHIILSHVSWWPAEIELISELCTDRYRQTQPGLFDKFVRHVSKSNRSLEYNVAHLLLCHPARPGAKRALSYVQQHLAGMSRQQFDAVFLPGTGPRQNVYFFLRRTVGVLQKEGMAGYAEKLTRLPEVFFSEQELAVLEKKFAWELSSSRGQARGRGEQQAPRLDGGQAAKHSPP